MYYIFQIIHLIDPLLHIITWLIYIQLKVSEAVRTIVTAQRLSLFLLVLVKRHGTEIYSKFFDISSTSPHYDTEIGVKFFSLEH